LVAADGGVFTFGNAQFLASMGGKSLDAAVVGARPRVSAIRPEAIRRAARRTWSMRHRLARSREPSTNFGDDGAMTLQEHVITVGGADRSYLVAEPRAGKHVSTVVLCLHGTRSTAARQARLSGFEALTRTAGAVAAFPQAVEPIGSGYEWDPTVDVDFLVGLATELLGGHQTPHGRVLLAGMSGGARMSSFFAGVHPELVQAVGAVAGLRSPALAVRRSVPILSFHGRKDRINPYGGSGTPRWNESVPDAARAWARANGITAPPTEVPVRTDAHPDHLRHGGAAGRGDGVDVAPRRSHLAGGASRAAAEPLARSYITRDRRHRVDLGVRCPPRRRPLMARTRGGEPGMSTRRAANLLRYSLRI